MLELKYNKNSTSLTQSIFFYGLVLAPSFLFIKFALVFFRMLGIHSQLKAISIGQSL